MTTTKPAEPTHRKIKARLIGFLAKIVGDAASSIVADILLILVFPSTFLATLLVAIQPLREWLYHILCTLVPVYTLILSVLITNLALYSLLKWKVFRNWRFRRRTLKYLSHEQRLLLRVFVVVKNTKTLPMDMSNAIAQGLVGTVLWTTSSGGIDTNLNYHIHDWAWRMLLDNPHLLDSEKNSSSPAKG